MGLKPKNKGHANFYECCDLTKKVYLTYICTKNFRKELHFHHKKIFDVTKTFPLPFITEYIARRNDMWTSYEQGKFTCRSCKESFKTLKELSVHRAKARY